MKKNAKGITLVAMVITIIVMLILAGVSISMVVGDNGVLTKAQKGSVDTVLSSIESDIGLAVNSVQTDYMGEFAESTSKAGDKKEYLTMKKLNDYLVECKLLDVKTPSAQMQSDDLGVKLTDNKNATSAPSGDFGDKKALTTISGIKSAIEYKDENHKECDYKVNPEKEKGTSTKCPHADGYIDAVGYACNVLYFSNGKNSTTFSGDLYVAIVHFENGFLVLDDIGIARKQGKGKDSKPLTLVQGGPADSTTLTTLLGADGLNVKWLKKGIGSDLTGVTQ